MTKIKLSLHKHKNEYRGRLKEALQNCSDIPRGRLLSVIKNQPDLVELILKVHLAYPNKSDFDIHFKVGCDTDIVTAVRLLAESYQPPPSPKFRKFGWASIG